MAISKNKKNSPAPAAPATPVEEATSAVEAVADAAAAAPAKDKKAEKPEKPAKPAKAEKPSKAEKAEKPAKGKKAAVEPEAAPASETPIADAIFGAVKAVVEAVEAVIEPVVEAAVEAVADAVQAFALATAPAAEPPAPPPLPPLEPLPPLPDAFGEDRLVLLARDPESAFLYWEITPDGVSRARAALGASAARAGLILRLYIGDPATDDGVEIVDRTVQDWVGRYTIHFDRPGQRATASIGFLAEGVFVHVTQSTPVRLPRRTPGAAPVRFVRLPLEHALPGEPPSVATEAPRPTASGVPTHQPPVAQPADRGATPSTSATGGAHDAADIAGSRHLRDGRNASGQGVK